MYTCALFQRPINRGKQLPSAITRQRDASPPLEMSCRRRADSFGEREQKSARWGGGGEAGGRAGGEGGGGRGEGSWPRLAPAADPRRAAPTKTYKKPRGECQLAHPTALFGATGKGTGRGKRCTANSRDRPAPARARARAVRARSARGAVPQRQGGPAKSSPGGSARGGQGPRVREGFGGAGGPSEEEEEGGIGGEGDRGGAQLSQR